jgi:hypothetical protein
VIDEAPKLPEHVGSVDAPIARPRPPPTSW